MTDHQDNPLGGHDAAAAPPVLPVPAAAEAPRAPRRGVGGIWVLIAIAALLLAGWQWVETRGRLTVTQQELAVRLAEQDRELEESRAAAREAREAGESSKARLAVIEARLAEFQAQYAALDAMYQDVARGRDESVISDAEQLIGLAAQQLQLAGNASGAVLALTQADARLAKIDRAQLANVRRLLARDIERLRSLPEVDLVSVSVKIESVVEAVDALSVAYQMRPSGALPLAEPEAGAEDGAEDGTLLDRLRGFGRGIWDEIRSLVRIQRFDRLEPALLSPTQEFFLRENLKLRLLNARLALLARDGNTFRHEIRQAQGWIERHFDLRQRPAAQAVATLAQLGALDIVVRLPRLDESLAAIRAIKLDHARSGR
jgi:uroporphyrin-3 C-methyltransferase